MAQEIAAMQPAALNCRQVQERGATAALNCTSRPSRSSAPKRPSMTLPSPILLQPMQAGAAPTVSPQQLPACPR